MFLHGRASLKPSACQQLHLPFSLQRQNSGPSSSLKGDLQRQLFLLIPIVTDVFHHPSPPASSSGKGRPLSASCGNGYTSTVDILIPFSWHHWRWQQAKQTTLITSLKKNFRAEDRAFLENSFLQKHCVIKEKQGYLQPSNVTKSANWSNPWIKA